MPSGLICSYSAIQISGRSRARPALDRTRYASWPRRTTRCTPAADRANPRTASSRSASASRPRGFPRWRPGQPRSRCRAVRGGPEDALWVGRHARDQIVHCQASIVHHREQQQQRGLQAGETGRRVLAVLFRYGVWPRDRSRSNRSPPDCPKAPADRRRSPARGRTSPATSAQHRDVGVAKDMVVAAPTWRVTFSPRSLATRISRISSRSETCARCTDRWKKAAIKITAASVRLSAWATMGELLGQGCEVLHPTASSHPAAGGRRSGRDTSSGLRLAAQAPVRPRRCPAPRRGIGRSRSGPSRPRHPDWLPASPHR